MMRTFGQGRIQIAPWHQTKYIFASSFTFLLPAFFAWNRDCYIHSIILLSCSFVSANYWRDANDCWRRSLDLALSKFAFVVFFCSGLHILIVSTSRYSQVKFLLTGSTYLSAMSIFYSKSSSLHQQGYPGWFRYHVLFHFCTVAAQMFVISNIAVADTCHLI